MSQTAIVTHWTVVDDPKGNPVRTIAWTASYPCLIDFRSSLEDEIRGQRVTTQKVCFLPPEAEVYAEDDITVDGTTYKVEGEPAALRAFGRPHHVEADIRSVDEEVRSA